MHPVKKIFQQLTGYWIHKIKSLPVGVDLFYDTTIRLNHGPLTTIFDVGANEGQTLEWMRHHQPAAKFYCFEPVHSAFQKLKKNAAQDHNCITENIAFGEAAGEKTIRLFETYSVLNSLKDELMSTEKNAKEEVIKIDTIDAYCKAKSIKQIDLLKIDTEGYELKVLEGADNMIANHQITFIYCEVGFQRSNQRNTWFPDLLTYLDSKGYYFFGMYDLSSHDWKRGNLFGNALFASKKLVLNTNTEQI